MKKSMRSLLDLATAEKPVVFMPYSRATVELASALRAHKNSLLERMSKEAAEQHLRDAVVVVSIGSGSDDWVDGPAYIHVAAFEDSLTNALGSNSKKPWGAGADAVFLNYNQPWNNSENEAHNFSSSGVQFLSVIMLVNKTMSFRKLYNLARSSDILGHSGMGRSRNASGTYREHKSHNDGNLTGNLVSSFWSIYGRIRNRGEAAIGGGNLFIPENVDDLTKAMIRITQGSDHLWSDTASDGAAELPSEQESIRLLKEYINADMIDTIVRSFQ